MTVATGSALDVCGYGFNAFRASARVAHWGTHPGGSSRATRNGGYALKDHKSARARFRQMHSEFFILSERLERRRGASAREGRIRRHRDHERRALGFHGT